MTRTAALLALALGFSAGPTLAQEPGEDAVREGRGEARGFDRADRPPTPPPAPEAPRAPEARVPDGGGRFYGPGGRGGIERRGGGDPDRDRGGDNDRDRGDRADRDRHDRDARRDDRRRDDRRWQDGDRHRDWRRDDRRRWDYDGWRDDRYWSWGRWPGVYSSPYRYRHSWRPPSGYYARDWRYGDYLPRGWYGSGWWIEDPWAFRLPLPPPGYGWVRSGDDALLIDRYDGRVVQVVRDVFW